jgi:hypothetical protein
MGRQIGHEISRCRKAPRICMFSVSYPGAHARIHTLQWFVVWSRRAMRAYCKAMVIPAEPRDTAKPSCAPTNSRMTPFAF